MNNFTKSILYSTTVLAVGLVAIFAIYDNVTQNQIASVAEIAPAAGESDFGIRFDAETGALTPEPEGVADVAPAAGEAITEETATEEAVTEEDSATEEVQSEDESAHEHDDHDHDHGAEENATEEKAAE